MILLFLSEKFKTNLFIKYFGFFKVPLIFYCKPKIVKISSNKYEPHRIPFYLYELATLFHSYWSKGNENEEFKFKVLTGEPASLVFSNDKSLYNYGVFEQTIPITGHTESDLMSIAVPAGMAYDMSSAPAQRAD